MILLGNNLIKGEFYRLEFSFSAYADYLITFKNGTHKIFQQQGESKLEFCEIHQVFEARADRIALKVSNCSIIRDSVEITHLDL